MKSSLFTIFICLFTASAFASEPQGLSAAVSLSKSIEVQGSLEDVQKVLTLQNISKVYPRLKNKKPVSSDTLWHHLEPMGTMGYYHEVKYLSKYSEQKNPSSYALNWVSVGFDEASAYGQPVNSLVSGSLYASRISENKLLLTLQASGTIHGIQAPSLFSTTAKKTTAKLFEATMSQFLVNLKNSVESP